VDIVAIDRRDEGLVEQFDGRLRNAVAPLFDGLYVVATALNVVEGRHQAGEFVTGLENLFGVVDEQVEEAAFGGHQAGKHGGSFVGKVVVCDIYVWRYGTPLFSG
jgi:hypothetical protein